MQFTRLFAAWRTMALCAVLAFLCHDAQATHAVGADLTYVCVGGNTYEITLRFYRDCGGVAFPSSPAVNISASSGCGFTSQSLTLSLQNSREVSQVCAGTTTTCAGGSVQGTQEARFTGRITLPAGCDSYTISYTECDRNSVITNLNSTAAGSFCIYVETELNTSLAACNNSPQFSNLPVLYGCQNQITQFNHGFVDVDGDSLVFSLTNPRTTNNVIIPFNSGLSATNPLLVQGGTTFQFDPTNGQMTFTPQANTSQVAVISVVIEEYRNGQKIGSMIRDLQMIISGTCTSQPPTPGNITPSFGSVSGNTVTLCGPTAPVTVDINASDPDVSDVLTATSDVASAIPGATYTVTGTNPITISLNMPTSGLSSGAYPFTVTINDGACPNPNVQIVGYSLRVVNNVPVVTATASASTLCTGESITLTATGASSYNWSGGISNGVPFTVTNSGNFFATVVGSDIYGCTDVDTVDFIVNPSPTINVTASSTSICTGESVTLSATGNGNGYTWSGGITDGVAFTPTNTTTYTVSTTSNNGCTNSQAVTISVNGPPTIGATATNMVVCTGQTTTLNGTGGSTYVWDNGVTDGVAFTPTNTTTYNVTGTDANGCVNTGQITITSSSNPAPTATISATRPIACPGAGTDIDATLGTGETIAWYRNGTLISGANSATYTTTQGGTYYNIVTNADGCTEQSANTSLSQGSIPDDARSIFGSSSLCYGERATYSTSNVRNATYYRWEVIPATAATISIGQGTDEVTINSTTQNFDLMVTPVNECGAGASTTESIASVDDISCSGPLFSAQNTNICEGQTVVFNNHTTRGVFGLTPRWNFGAGASPASATTSGPHTVTYNTAGAKTVTLEYVGTFGNPFQTLTYVDYINVETLGNCGVSVQRLEDADWAAEVSPNPTSGLVQVAFATPLEEVTVELVDLQGRTLLSRVWQRPTVEQLDLTELPAGWYAIRLISARQQQTLKVLKH